MQRRKIAAITGVAGGIGSAIVDHLAVPSWILVSVDRNVEKAKQPNATLAASQTIIALHPQIDAIYNNSGTLTSEQAVSAQSHESHNAVNTLVACVMTKSLRPALRRDDAVEGTIIINRTSSVFNAARSLDTETLCDPKISGSFTGASVTTKLALTTMSTPTTKKSDAMPGILKMFVPFYGGALVDQTEYGPPIPSKESNMSLFLSVLGVAPKNYSRGERND